jgi:hypothetical protein
MVTYSLQTAKPYPSFLFVMNLHGALGILPDPPHLGHLAYAPWEG